LDGLRIPWGAIREVRERSCSDFVVGVEIISLGELAGVPACPRRGRLETVASPATRAC
jgi:hypothetical protein